MDLLNDTKTEPLLVEQLLLLETTTVPLIFNNYDSSQQSSPNNFSEFVNILLHILYNLVLVGGVVGNLLVIYVIYSVPRMRTVTNYLLANLAIGDLIIASLCVPFTYLSIIYGYWPFGHFLCNFVSPFNAIGVLVSAFTLIALAIEKYVAILHPLAPRLRKSRVSWIIGAIWMSAGIISAPIAIVVGVKERNVTIETDYGFENISLPMCEEFGWNEGQELSYSVSLMMIQYFIPLAVLAFTYSRIAYVVWGIQHDKPALDGHNGEINLHRNTRTDKRSRKAVLLTLAVVAGYTLAWLPYNVNYIIFRQYPTLAESLYFQYVSIGCHWLAMSHCFYNPFIYGWINNSFKKAFHDVCLKLACCCCMDRKSDDLRNLSSSRSTRRRSSLSTTMTTLRWKSYRKISFTPEPLTARKQSIAIIPANRKSINVNK